MTRTALIASLIALAGAANAAIAAEPLAGAAGEAIAIRETASPIAPAAERTRSAAKIALAQQGRTNRLVFRRLASPTTGDEAETARTSPAGV